MSRLWVALAAVAGVAGAAGAACGDSGRAPRPPERADAARPREPAYTAGPDTASPVPYLVFDPKVETEDPRRLTLRMLVFQPENTAGVAKSVRLAFDSVAAADARVVAARAILYAPRARSQSQADLVPIGWAAWVPPEGWASVGPDSRRRIHRTHVYFGTAPDPAIVGDLKP